MRLGLSVSLAGQGGGESAPVAPVLSGFVDDLDQDPPALFFNSTQAGTATWDFHSSATPPASGAGDIGTGTYAVEVGANDDTIDLSAHAGETGYVHIRVANGNGTSNILTSQQITVATADFIFTVETTGTDETFTIPCQNSGTFNATITSATANAPHDSGASVTAYNDSNLVLTFASAGTHTINVSGTFPNIYFNNGGDRLKVRTVQQLGDVGWANFNRAFLGCSNMTAFVVGTTDTSAVTLMDLMFDSCSSLTSLGLSAFDTSQVTNIGAMFRDCSGLTSLNISNFNTSNVTNFIRVFRNCSSITSLNVSGFNTGSATSMAGMFQDCDNLASLDVSGFDISNLNDTGALNTFISGGGGMTTVQYDATLIAWAAQTVLSGLSPNFGTSQYTSGGAAETARTSLINDDSWTIIDGGAA